MFDSCNIPTLRNIEFIVCGGKAYQMEIKDDYLAIYEKYQDEFNKWHVRLTPAYFLAGDEVQYLLFYIGSDYAYNILQYLQKVKVI